MGRELNENEKVNVLENPKIVQEMMKSRLGETAHVKLENAVSDLEERHKEIMKIERVFTCYYYSLSNQFMSYLLNYKHWLSYKEMLLIILNRMLNVPKD